MQEDQKGCKKNNTCWRGTDNYCTDETTRRRGRRYRHEAKKRRKTKADRSSEECDARTSERLQCKKNAGYVGPLPAPTFFTTKNLELVRQFCSIKYVHKSVVVVKGSAPLQRHDYSCEAKTIRAWYILVWKPCLQQLSIGVNDFLCWARLMLLFVFEAACVLRYQFE